MSAAGRDSAFFAANRARLGDALPGGAMAVVGSNDPLVTNADGTLGVFRNSDLYYLTGIAQEETMLLLFPDANEPADREILILRRPDPVVERWEGAKLTQDEATRVSGVRTVLHQDAFDPLFHRLMTECECLYVNANEHPRAHWPQESRDLRFARHVRHAYPLHRLERLAPLLRDLRMIKSPPEIEAIRKACRLTAGAFRDVLGQVAPGIPEKEIEARFAYAFTRAGARFAYDPIIASGASSCVLHSIRNDGVLTDGEVLLMDVGAMVDGYCADLTRTVPVGDSFTDRQQHVHDAVRRVQRSAIARIRPGALWRDIQDAVRDDMAVELDALGLMPAAWRDADDRGHASVREYFPHGLGHPLGLDVHDVGDLSRPLEPGCVLTVEPGIYIPSENIGVRIETNVVVTTDGCEDLFADLLADGA